MGKQLFSQVQQINYAMYFTLGLAMCSLYVHHASDNTTDQTNGEKVWQDVQQISNAADTSVYKHFLQ